MPLLKERGHPWYWNEAFLVEIFCLIKPKSKSDIWAHSNKKAMLDARLLGSKLKKIIDIQRLIRFFFDYPIKSLLRKLYIKYGYLKVWKLLQEVIFMLSKCKSTQQISSLSFQTILNIHHSTRIIFIFDILYSDFRCWFDFWLL